MNSNPEKKVFRNKILKYKRNSTLKKVKNPSALMSRVTNELDDQRDFHPPPSTTRRDLFHALLAGSRWKEYVSSYSGLSRNVKSCKDQRLEIYCSFFKIFDASKCIFSFSPLKHSI